MTAREAQGPVWPPSPDASADALGVNSVLAPFVPSAQEQQALDGALLGVWAEPEDPAPQQVPAVSTSSSTTSTTGAVLTCEWDMGSCSTPTSSTTTSTVSLLCSSSLEDADAVSVLAGVNLVQLPDLDVVSRQPFAWWPSTTSSTSSSPSLSWPDEVVRDSVNHELVASGQADAVELVHHLLDRQRQLRHCDRLIQDAIEEAMRWFQLPRHAAAFNVGVHARNLWRVILAESAFGSGPSRTSSSTWANSPVVLVQPNHPDTVEALLAALPGTRERTIAGYRRRGWRRHVADVFAAQGRDVPLLDVPAADDCELYIVQADPESALVGWHGDVPLARSDRRARHSFTAGRRRLRAARPLPFQAGSGVGPGVGVPVQLASPVADGAAEVRAVGAPGAAGPASPDEERAADVPVAGAPRAVASGSPDSGSAYGPRRPQCERSRSRDPSLSVRPREPVVLRSGRRHSRRSGRQHSRRSGSRHSRRSFNRHSRRRTS